jgi:hypothetical protein
METVCFFETLVSTYKSIRPYNPEDQHGLIFSENVLKDRQEQSPFDL